VRSKVDLVADTNGGNVPRISRWDPFVVSALAENGFSEAEINSTASFPSRFFLSIALINAPLSIGHRTVLFGLLRWRAMTS
jgi:hypothetical protein